MTPHIKLLREAAADIRPASFSEFTGQDRQKARLQTALQSALARQDAVGHILLTGPPGLGKTTLARLIASEMRTKLLVVNGATVDTLADLSSYLVQVDAGDVVFIDEIHRLLRPLEEMLYPIMEDFEGDVVLNKKLMRLRFPQFTIVGATTRAGLVSKPLFTRFQLVEQLDFYTVEELTGIVSRSALVLGLQLADGVSVDIARRSRGTARIANNILSRVRDYAIVAGSMAVDAGLAATALAMLDLDANGLTLLDRRLLAAIIEKFGGGPVGVGSLAIALGEEPDTLAEAVEPHLIRQGLLKRTPQGRVATAEAFTLLGLTPKAAEVEVKLM